MVNRFSKDPQFIKSLFNSISSNYDKLNDIMSFGLHRLIKNNVLKQAKDYKLFNHSTIRPFNFLDLCCGTGDLVGILKNEYPEAKIIGVDFSAEMLKIAREKYSANSSRLKNEGDNNIEFIEADCTQLPFEDESFDLCTVAFGLRNVEDLDKALREIYRVLKPGGVFINLDLGKPNKFFNLFLKPYMYLWVSLLGKVFHGNETPYKYLAVSNESFPSPRKLMKMYEGIGFCDIKNKNYLFGQIASQNSCKK